MVKVKSCDGMPSKVSMCDFEVYIEIRRKLPLTSGNGFTSEPTGRYAMSRVRVTVDLMQIARQIGGKAMMAKSGKSKYMGGCVVAHRVNGSVPDIMESGSHEPQS